jgi:predicted aconitase with swiveling domain
MVMVTGRPLIPGNASGPLLRLDQPISFWGGVDPKSGAIMDPRHPNHGDSISGTVLAIPAAVGSSSSSAIMLELLREGTAPAAILIGKADAILSLGVIVGRELGYPEISVIELPREAQQRWAQHTVLQVLEDGTVQPA